jgi:hypothetical protein
MCEILLTTFIHSQGSRYFFLLDINTLHLNLLTFHTFFFHHRHHHHFIILTLVFMFHVIRVERIVPGPSLGPPRTLHLDRRHRFVFSRSSVVSYTEHKLQTAELNVGAVIEESWTLPSTTQFFHKQRRGGPIATARAFLLCQTNNKSLVIYKSLL